MDILQKILLYGPVLLFSVVAHEYAHGYAAMKQGDLTAYSLGRLTFNPVKHIDPFMTILLPALLAFMNAPVLGAAKPVPVNPRNYRNYKRGDIIVSMAGIVTNLTIALLCVPLIIVIGYMGLYLPTLIRPLGVLQHMVIAGIQINLFLAVFNLIPIPPLDGSHVFKYLLPPAWALQYQRLAGVGFFILIALLSLGVIAELMEPALILTRLAMQVWYPFMLPNPLLA